MGKIRKKSYKISFLIAFLFLFGLFFFNGCMFFRQYGNLEGYVYVPESSKSKAVIVRDTGQAPTGYKPLPGARVSVQDSYEHVSTDSNGYFLLEHIIAGPVNILIEPPLDSGYNALSTQVMVEPDTTASIGTYGEISLPSSEADHWDIIINRIDDSKYPEVKVYVSVIDPGNDSPMRGIDKDSFEIEINENPLNKENIKSVEQATGEVSKPASMSLVIDRSGSMEGENYDDQPLEDAKTGAKTFVELMSSEDRAEVISFGDNATLDQSFTHNKQSLYSAINSLNSGGATALYDAIWLGIEDTAKETNPCKAVIALTDGAENNSSSLHGGGNYDFDYGTWLEYPDNSDLIDEAEKANIPIYTIGLQGFNFTRENVARNYDTTEKDLEEISDETGGEYIYAPKSAQLEDIYEDIKQRMEQQYIITFTDDTATAEGSLSVVLNYSQLYGYDTINYNPPAQLSQSNKPVIKSIDPPNPGANQSKQWISILGENFHENSEVMFTHDGEEHLIEKERVKFRNSQKIEVYVGLTEDGEWSIKITNIDVKKSDEFIFNVVDFLKDIIPRALLEEIEKQAREHYNQRWKDTISESQFMAWITAIAYGEGKYGGFTAHSTGNSGEDYFVHYALRNDFYFSTGIGPFQIDRGGEESGDLPWHKWPTIDKLDYEKTTETVAKQHHYQFNRECHLENFSDLSRSLNNKFKWVAVNPTYPSGADVDEKWEAITGTTWADNKDKFKELEWEKIKERLATDDFRYKYEENVSYIGKKKWEIKSTDNIITDDDDDNLVVLDGYYDTWLIKVLNRDQLGITEFTYYYMLEKSEKIEIWCYADDQEYTHIFLRKYSTGQYPEGCKNGKCGFTLSDSAVIP